MERADRDSKQFKGTRFKCLGVLFMAFCLLLQFIYNPSIVSNGSEIRAMIPYRVFLDTANRTSKPVVFNRITVRPKSLKLCFNYSNCSLETIQKMAQIAIMSQNQTDFAVNQLEDTLLTWHRNLTKEQMLELRKIKAEKKHKSAKEIHKSAKNSSKTYFSSQAITALAAEPPKSTQKRALAFIKAYKVGGTHVAALLTVYLFLNDLEVDGVGQWKNYLVTGKKRARCVDVVGTTHPSTGFYEQIQQANPKFRDHYYCKPPVEFMFIRDPIKRLWSGYNHALRDQSMLSLRSYLKSHSKPTVGAPHLMISKSLAKAKNISHNILMLRQDDGLMDLSLMILSREANLSICDFMYKPCEAVGNDFGTSKCNSYEPNIGEGNMRLLRAETLRSGEQEFFDTVVGRFNNTIQSHKDIEQLLSKYNRIRGEAVDRCENEEAYKYAEIYLYLHPKVKAHLKPDNTRRWRHKDENIHTIDPVWICMQWFCQSQFSRT